jgi:hypothetical protein
MSGEGDGGGEWWEGDHIRRNPQGTDLIINEIGPKNNDFIELYNPTGSAISLVGWSVTVGAATYSILTGSVPAGGYFVLDWNAFSPTTPRDWLPNGGTTVALLNPSNTVVDQTTYPSGLSPQQSWSRYVDQSGNPVDTDSDSFDFYVGQRTKGRPNTQGKNVGVVPEFDSAMVLAVPIAFLGLVFLTRRKRRR